MTELFISLCAIKSSINFISVLSLSFHRQGFSQVFFPKNKENMVFLFHRLFGSSDCSQGSSVNMFWSPSAPSCKLAGGDFSVPQVGRGNSRAILG